MEIYLQSCQNQTLTPSPLPWLCLPAQTSWNWLEILSVSLMSGLGRGQFPTEYQDILQLVGKINPEPLGQDKLVLHRRHYSPPNSGDLTHQKWRGNNPLAQPELRLEITEGICLCGAGKGDAPSASAQGTSKFECFSAETDSLLKDCISFLLESFDFQTPD